MHGLSPKDKKDGLKFLHMHVFHFNYFFFIKKNDVTIIIITTIITIASTIIIIVKSYCYFRFVPELVFA